MKYSIKLSVSTFLILSSTALFATNGDLMIGQGAKSVSMGGVGIAKSFGSDSGIANPALISSVQHSEISANVTVFMPDVKFGAFGFDKRSSTSDLSFIPEFSYVRNLNAWAIGVQASGVAGMGVDYDNTFNTANDNGSFNMQTELQLFKIAIPISYKLFKGLSIGVEPVIQLGSLQMNYMKGNGEMSNNPKSSSTGLGFEIGAAYAYNGWTIGAVYKSEIEMSYANNISSALNDFEIGSIASGDTLTQPSEYGVGISYVYHHNTIAFDYKVISWSSASGYSDFNWQDQSVFAIGYQHIFSKLALRVGYNYAQSPISEQNSATYDGSALNYFNLVGFPGIVEQHITFGLGYDFSKALSLDAAFVYSPEVKESYDITAMSSAIGYPSPASADVTHSQSSFTAGVTYKFY